jgi:hypothetical protein
MEASKIGPLTPGNIHNLDESLPDDSIGFVVISLELMEQALYMGFALPFPGPKSSSSMRF